MAVDHSTEIAALEEILNSGARSITVDGVTTQFQNAEEIQRRIDHLKSEDDTSGQTVTKPRMSSINMGSAMP